MGFGIDSRSRSPPWSNGTGRVVCPSPQVRAGIVGREWTCHPFLFSAWPSVA